LCLPGKVRAWVGGGGRGGCHGQFGICWVDLKIVSVKQI
jgi:hypothetical protein